MEITRGIIACAKKTVIYGPEGIGKTTMASLFPDAVFIDTEGSTSHMDVSRLPKPSSFTMLLEEVRYVREHPECCKTLVIDTADWAEKLCIEEVCASKRVGGIEDIGYGKGYVYVKESFGRLLNLLDEVIERGIHVVLVAHAMMRKFEQPDELGAYDRWEMKLSKQTSPLVKEWADMLLFCNYKTMVVNVDNQGAQKGRNKAQGGRRVMYTAHHACWDAKNRFSLPEEADMSYEVIRPVIEAGKPQTVHREEESASTKDPSSSVPDTVPSQPPTQETAPATTYSIPDGKQIDMLDYKHVQAGEEIKTVPERQPLDAVPEKEPERGSMDDPISLYYSDPEKIPKSLKELMEEHDIGEWYVQEAVAARGYYPVGTLIENMDPEFIQGVLVAAWPQVYAMMKEMRDKEEIPFG